MSATLVISALFAGPLLGVLVALALRWSAGGVVMAAVVGAAIAYAGLQLGSRYAMNRALDRARAGGENFLATAAYADAGARVRGLVAVLVLALAIAGVALLARRLLAGATP
jgi:hypothetical protein